jgi:hypothetical protein
MGGIATQQTRHGHVCHDRAHVPRKPSDPTDVLHELHYAYNSDRPGHGLDSTQPIKQELNKATNL